LPENPKEIVFIQGSIYNTELF